MDMLPRETPDSPLLSYVPHPVMIRLPVWEPHEGRPKPESSLSALAQALPCLSD